MIRLLLAILLMALSAIVSAPSSAQNIKGGVAIPGNNPLPSNSIGLDNEYYLDFYTGNVFGPKTAGQWPVTAVQGIVTGNVNGFAPGNLAIGNSTGGLVDSGVQPAKNNATNRAPTVNDDVTQGYTPGSIWAQTPSGPSFSMYNNTQGAAVWGQTTPSAYHPYETKTWGFGNIAAGLTYYLAVDAAGVNQNYGNIAAKTGTLSTLYARTAASPGAGQTYTFTLYVGAIGAMSATAVTCQISGASTTQCSDLVDTAAITAGQQWAVQLVTSASAAGTGQSMASLLVTY